MARNDTNATSAMEIDSTEEESTAEPSISRTNNNNEEKAKRKTYTTKRKDGVVNKATHLTGTGIYYYDDLKIGNGATATVYQGYHMLPAKPAAIKRVNVDQSKVYQNELNIWMSIGVKATPDNVNVVQLFECTKWKDGGIYDALYFAMELATADLKKWIAKFEEDCNELSSKAQSDAREQGREKVIGYLRDAANGLQWIHKKRIIHRDIKPENILIFSSNGQGNEIAKLGDFGISRKLENISTGTNSIGQGTEDWMPPEVIHAFHHEITLYTTPRIDIFSFGMTAHYAMSFGAHPFKRSRKYGISISRNIEDMDVLPGSLLDIEPTQNEHSANHLFQWMMQKSERRRPQKMHHVLEHPYFWDPSSTLKFLVDVAKALDRKNEGDVQELQKQIDLMFNQVFKEYESLRRRPPAPSSFDWQKELGSDLFPLLQGRQSSTQIKKYPLHRITSLLELIRDKSVHYQDLKEELLQDQYFGVNGSFCEVKFVKYFMTKFPYLVIFLYTELCKDLKRYSFLNSFKKTHKLTGKSDIPSLPPVQQYLSSLESLISNVINHVINPSSMDVES